MGKAAMCIQMLQILHSGRVYKCSELADKLETNPRNVIEYKKELEEAGYFIKSIPGKYGGYQLDQSTIIPTLRLSVQEKAALLDGSGYLLARQDFMAKKDYEKAMTKIYSVINNVEPELDVLAIDKYPLVIDKEDLEKCYAAIKDCISKYLCLNITYVGLDNIEITKTIQPYRLYVYNNAWYVIAYVEGEDEARYFKLARIKKYLVTNKKFHKRYSYNPSEYLDEFGMRKNGDWYPIKLKITGAYAVIAKEKAFGKNQVVEELNDGSVILSCEMQNKERIKSFVLGMGKYCEIIEPDWLQSGLLKTISLISEKLRDDK